MFHHHPLCNFTNRQNTTFKSTQARPTYARVSRWYWAVLSGLREGATGPLSSPAWPIRPFFSHILFSSPPGQGAGSAHQQEAISHHWSVLGFSGNKLWVMCVQEGRRTVQDFPPHPLLFLALMEKQFLRNAPLPHAHTRSRLTSTQGRQRLYPNANSSQHGNDRFGQDSGCSGPKALQQNLHLPNPAGKRSCPPNTRHKIALQGKTIELPVAARALWVGAARPQSTLQSETALTLLP